MNTTICWVEITDECICCDACISACPLDAIVDSGDDDCNYSVKRDVCNCCVVFTEMQCAACCPVDAITTCYSIGV